MKRYFLIAWIASSLMMFATGSMAFDSQVIDVQLVTHSTVGKNASGVVTVTIRNLAKIPVYLPRVRTPTENVQGRLLGDIFDVVDRTGHRARFIGTYNDIPPLNPDGFYTKMEPGESRSRDVDIATDYDLSSDEEFTVQYSQPFTTVIKMIEGGEIDTRSQAQLSEKAAIWVARANKSALLTNPALLPLSTSAEPDTCNTQQRSAILAALNASGPLVRKASNGIQALHYDVVGKNARGDTTYQSTIKPDDDYTYWFGAPVNTVIPETTATDVYEFWDTNDDYVMMKTINAISVRTGGGLFMCGCIEGTDPNTAAQTETESHTVRLCVPTFFNLPATNQQYVSQLLTVIHEYSHFHDSFDVPTGDYAYGLVDAHALTTSARSNAVRNADNIMYYIGTFNK